MCNIYLQPATCMMCETPTPATQIAGDLELCDRHANALLEPDRCCERCGQPLSEEDIAAGETRCLDCEGLALLAEIDMSGPLAATVRTRLEAL